MRTDRFGISDDSRDTYVHWHICSVSVKTIRLLSAMTIADITKCIRSSNRLVCCTWLSSEKDDVRFARFETCGCLGKYVAWVATQIYVDVLERLAWTDCKTCTYR